MGLDDGIPEKTVIRNEPEYEVIDPEEHTHSDGTVHSHIDGQKPHTHDDKCNCTELRNRHCPQHG